MSSLSQHDLPVSKDVPQHVEIDTKDKEEVHAPLISAFATLSPKESMVKFKRVFAYGLLASLGGMYVGYCGSAVGNIVANIGFIEQFGTVTDADGALALNAQYVSLWGGLGQLGQIVMQFSSSLVVDRFGRKSAMYSLLVFMAISIALALAAKDWKVFLAAKVFGGAASGWLGPAVMTYMSEVSISQFRGIMLSCFSLSLALGQFTNSIACEIVNTTTPYDYRRILYSDFVYLGIFAIACVVIPESPVWLISIGNHEKAKKNLSTLIGDVQGYDLDHEFDVLVAEIRQSEAITKSYSDNDWKALFRWGNFRRCLVASLPFAAQQFAGVPYIFFYTTYFFQQSGVTNPFTANTIVNVIYVCSIVLSFFLVDRVGRRPLVLWGLVALTAANLVIGAVGFANTDSNAKNNVLVAFTAIWMFAYSISLAPIGWLGIVEVSSARLRAKTASFGVLVNSFIGLIFTYCVPLMLSPQGAGWAQKIGLFFAGTSFLFLIPSYLYYPETKGRTYAEIDELFESGVSARKFATTRTAAQAVADAHTVQGA